MIFFPSTRYGSLSVERSKPPRSRSTSWTRFPASVMTPRTSSTSAPYERHSSIMDGGVSSGIAMNTGTPARAPYAARADPALPAVGAARSCAPRRRAIVTAAAMPRALNERVGLSDSSLIRSPFIPRERPRRTAGSRGVSPSPRVTMSLCGTGGRTSLHRHIPRGREPIRARSGGSSPSSYRTRIGAPHAGQRLRRASIGEDPSQTEQRRRAGKFIVDRRSSIVAWFLVVVADWSKRDVIPSVARDPGGGCEERSGGAGRESRHSLWPKANTDPRALHGARVTRLPPPRSLATLGMTSCQGGAGTASGRLDRRAD